MYVFKDSLGRIAGELSRNIGKILEVEFQKMGHSLSGREWGIISYLFNNEGMNQNSLCEVTGSDKVSVKRMIDGLESQKLVRRKVSPVDRRHYILSLTKKGVSVYDELSPLAARIIASSSSDIHVAELQLAIKTLKKINQNLKKMVEQTD